MSSRYKDLAQLYVVSYISDKLFSESQHLASYFSHHDAMVYDRLAQNTSSQSMRLMGVEKRRFSLAALSISLYRNIPKPNIDLHGRVDTAGLPRAD